MNRIHFLLPILVYSCFFGLCLLWGFKITIPQGYFQFLDIFVALEDPYEALKVLHTQPPIINSLVLTVFSLSNYFQIDLAIFCYGLLHILGCFASVLLYFLVLKITGSVLLSLGALLVTIFNPTTFIFSNLFFYPYFEFVLFICLAYLLYLLFNANKKLVLYAIALVLVLLSNIHSLFHPIFSITFFILTCLFLKICQPEHFLKSRGSIPGIFLLLLIGLFAWPLKNYIYFSHFTYSTYDAFNVSLVTDVRNPDLMNYIDQGIVPERTEKKVADLKWQFNQVGQKLISDVSKHDASRNWNHYIFADYRNELKEEVINWFLSNPFKWLHHSVAQYTLWSQAGSQNPYDGEHWLNPSSSFDFFADTYKSLFFFDVAPLLKTFPFLWDLFSNIKRQLNYNYSFYGFVVYPILLFLFIVFSYQELAYRKNPFYVLLLFCMLWILFIPCLSDGTEGHRYRFSISAVENLLLFVILNRYKKNLFRFKAKSS